LLWKFNEYFNDPYSMRFVRWSPITKYSYQGTELFWAVSVKLRAKNVLGAYVLAEETYLIQKGKVVKILKGYLYKESDANSNYGEKMPQIRNIKLVKARVGETLAMLAFRVGANVNEVAKFNGLLPTSVLPAGREIKIPSK